MLLRLYTRFNILSLDVALGAVCSALFFGRLLRVEILSYGLLSLAMSVWIIYTADHLLDARRIKDPASTERHRFHQRNFKALCIAVTVMVVADLVVVSLIRKAVLKGGLILICICLLYLLAHRLIRFPKELLIAILYTAGVLLPSLPVTPLPINDWPIALMIQFMLTALLNLTIFSWLDRERDQKDGNTSIISLIGEKYSQVLLWSIVGVNLLLCFFNADIVAAILVGLMNAALMFIFLKGNVFLKEEKFRLIGDAVFYIPLLYLLQS
jgi:hypothetical protein